MSERGVVAIIMVIVVITVLIILTGGLAVLTPTGYKSYHFSKDRAQALYLAEAGISSAIWEIKGDGYLPIDYDSDAKIGSIFTASLGDGSYSVDRTAIMPSRGGVEATSKHGSLGDLDNPKYYLYQLTSTGEINGVSRQAEVTHKVIIDIEEFKHIASYTSSCDITGAYQTLVLPRPLMDYFRSNADPDHIYESGFTSSAGDNLFGVYYVQGNTTLREMTTLHGTIVVENGWLTIENQCTIDPSQNPDFSRCDFPAILVYSASGNDILIKKESTIKGLIYAHNPIITQGDCQIEGVLIGTKIKIGANNQIVYEEVSPPGFWGGTSSSGGTTRKVSLELGTWQSS